MDPSIAPIAQIFGASTALYDRALAGLNRKTLLKYPGAPAVNRRPPSLQSIWPGRSPVIRTRFCVKLNIRKMELTVKKKTHKICMKDGFGLVADTDYQIMHHDPNLPANDYRRNQ